MLIFRPSKGFRSEITIILFILCSFLGLGLSLAYSGNLIGEQAEAIAPTDLAPTDLAPTDLTPTDLNQTNLAQTPNQANTIGTIDPIPERYQLGAELYLEQCATCHIGVPPQVLPIQTWQQVLDDTEHYGTRIPLLVDPTRLLIWQYVRHFSRSLKDAESIPFHIASSRFFNALHPRVNFSATVSGKVTLRQCLTCHPGAEAYNFRELTAEWNNAP